MATYQSIKKQIAELEKQAEALRKAEAAKIVASIRIQIAKFDLKPADLFDEAVAAPERTPVAITAPSVVTPPPAPIVKASAPRRHVLPAKYMDPVSKKTWSGHGKAPEWVKKGKREDYLIEAVEARLSSQPATVTKAARTKSTAAKKPVAQTKKASPTAKKPVAPATKAVAAAKPQPTKAAKMPVAPKKTTTPSPKKPTAVKNSRPVLNTAPVASDAVGSPVTAEMLEQTPVIPASLPAATPDTAPQE